MKPLPHSRWSLILRGWLLLLLFSLTASATAAPLTQSEDPASLPPPETVTIAGTLQSEIGCSGVWNTTCEESMLTYDAEDDLWMATWDIPAGYYEYKAALNGSWEDNYGLNAEYYGPNIPLELTADTTVTFWYDHKTRWVSDSVNSLFVIVAGTFQDELGCATDGQADCYQSLLQDPNGDGIYTFVTGSIPPGDYEVSGILPGAEQAIPFTLTEGQAILFTYNSADGTLETTIGNAAEMITVAAAPSGLPPQPPPNPTPSPSPALSRACSAVLATGNPNVTSPTSPSTKKINCGRPPSPSPLVITNTKPLSTTPGTSTLASTPNPAAPTSPFPWPKRPPSPSTSTPTPVGSPTASTTSSPTCPVASRPPSVAPKIGCPPVSAVGCKTPTATALSPT